MAEAFIAIQTQEEFDQRIKDRLERERKKVEEQFTDYESLKKQVKTLTDERTGLEKRATDGETKATDLQTQLDEANKKIKGFELDNLKTTIAIQKGLPLELRSRLTGETKEEIEKDADVFAGIFKAQNQKDLPLANLGGDGKAANTSDKAYKEMLSELNLGGKE